MASVEPYGINLIITGDIRDIAPKLARGSVHCICTSPPYYSLRDYGVEGQIGLEETPQVYVETLVSIFRELKRVLRDDGTVWLVIGDSYCGSGEGGGGNRKGNENGQHDIMIGKRPKVANGLKPKDLIGIPWRVALALQADGWYLRADIIWAKKNPMPESVRDRPTKAHEYIFLLSKSPRYFYDQEAVREENSTSTLDRHKGDFNSRIYRHTAQEIGIYGKSETSQINKNGELRKLNGRNRRTVWTLATAPFPGAHFAVFPPDLIRPCILAGCPERVCAECGAPWVRVVEKSTSFESGSGKAGNKPNGKYNGSAQAESGSYDIRMGPIVQSKTTGFRPTCNHYDHLYLQDFPKSHKARKRYQRDTSGDWWRRVRQRPGLDSWPSKPGVVLDPFMGSGTVAQVAIEEGRNWLGVELNPDYIKLAVDRIEGAKPKLPYEQAELIYG